MTPFARWALAICSGSTALIVAVICVTYSGIELNNAKWNKLELPTAAQYYVMAGTAWIPIATMLCIYNIYYAYRKNDSSVIIGSSIAWMFAITSFALCILAWRAPHAIIGIRLDG